MGVTELGRMLVNEPNRALSVLFGLGRWEAGRSKGGMDPRRRGWVRMGEDVGSNGSGCRRSSSNSNG